MSLIKFIRTIDRRHRCPKINGIKTGRQLHTHYIAEWRNNRLHGWQIGLYLVDKTHASDRCKITWREIIYFDEGNVLIYKIIPRTEHDILLKYKQFWYKGVPVGDCTAYTMFGDTCKFTYKMFGNTRNHRYNTDASSWIDPNPHPDYLRNYTARRSASKKIFVARQWNFERFILYFNNVIK